MGKDRFEIPNPGFEISNSEALITRHLTPFDETTGRW
jgi:hypothetical protein